MTNAKDISDDLLNFYYRAMLC